jgi:hypothetical protein
MAKPKVRDLVPKDDLPPAPVVERFITRYVNERDLKIAACGVGLPPEMGEKLYKNEKVRKRIDHKILLIDTAEAKIKAQKSMLSVDCIDAALYEEVKNKASRKWSLRLAYERKGVIRDGEFYVAPDPNANNNAPSMYRAQQTTLRHTVTEITHTDAAAIPVQHHDPIFAVKEY